MNMHGEAYKPNLFAAAAAKGLFPFAQLLCKGCFPQGCCDAYTAMMHVLP